MNLNAVTLKTNKRSRFYWMKPMKLDYNAVIKRCLCYYKKHARVMSCTSMTLCIFWYLYFWSNNESGMCIFKVKSSGVLCSLCLSFRSFCNYNFFIWITKLFFFTYTINKHHKSHRSTEHHYLSIYFLCIEWYEMLRFYLLI